MFNNISTRNILACTVTTLSFIYPLIQLLMQPNNISLHEAYVCCGSHGVILTITM